MAEVKKHILCIEDDRETADLLAEDLAQRGFAVSLAFDGHEGLAALLSNKPDLVLCDVNMPVMSGFEVYEKLALPRHAIHFPDGLARSGQ